ncbi:diaminopimelate epimerase [Yimella sp. cx-51]|uniref:diaminopimelate epimerase n=1 Tax=Yimella sp. cx-51 TaxID=2770551 RepID=UPI00165DB803|nr:diaminopimelate epimerase [Yimella sp. cx-51]MBC9957218.1 diaminopimelate epimerase [Yimella sp. cx-51]QTH37136.1 diaminopimelate epimerase [Yimella sp. cx-51]
MAIVTTIKFSKGHGTQNDFVVVPDLDGSLDLTPQDVVYLADRRAGIGGDGVIRVAPIAAAPDEVRAQAPEAQWFMDYRNSDGSIGEMCGNGSRVFARYLVEHGLVSDETFEIATRAGQKRITTVPGGFATDLGPWRLSRETEAQERGMDSVVQVHGAPDPLPALSLDTGVPHTVVALPPSIDLSQLNLTSAPHVDPHPPHGTNVDFVRAIEHGHIAMRVHERGAGETLSCGTGAAAAALATWWWGGQPADQLDWRVDLPGGTLGVIISADRVALSGPAVLVAHGEAELPPQ